MSVARSSVVMLELGAWVVIFVGLVCVVLMARRLRRWTVLPALPLFLVFATVGSWLIVETTWMRSWATRPNAALDGEALERSRVGDYTVELHKGAPVVSFTTETQGRYGVVRENFRFFAAPVWFVDRAVQVVGPVVGGMLAVVFLLVPRRDSRRGWREASKDRDGTADL